MIREDDLIVLTSIGLSKTEAVIYLDLVKNPDSSVMDIASRTGFHRPNVYNSTRRLREKGLITEVIEGGGNLFRALEPERLKLYLKQKEIYLGKLISDLKNP